MQATSTLLRSSSTKQRKDGPATRAARQLLDLICPEEAWVKLLRCRSWNSGRLSRPA